MGKAVGTKLSGKRRSHEVSARNPATSRGSFYRRLKLMRRSSGDAVGKKDVVGVVHSFEHAMGSALVPETKKAKCAKAFVKELIKRATPQHSGHDALSGMRRLAAFLMQ